MRTHTTITSMGEVAAGWYADPAGTGRRRYFDGKSWTEHFTQPLSVDERSDILDMTLARERFGSHARVESRSSTQAVVVFGHPPNHVLHAIITIFSCGLWAVVWIIEASTTKERRMTVTVDREGNVVWN